MFVDDFAEFVGLQTTDEHNRWRRFWRPLLDIWRGFERKDKEIAEMNGNPILLRSQSRNAKSSFETAISIGVENEADLLLRKLGHNLPATENVQQGWEQVGDLERRIRGLRSESRNPAIPGDLVSEHVFSESNPDYEDPVEARSAYCAQLENTYREIKLANARTALHTAWRDMRVFRQRLSSWAKKGQATGRKVWVEVVVDWTKLVIRRPKLIPETVRRRIESELPEDAHLKPELRLVSFMLPLKEFLRAERMNQTTSSALKPTRNCPKLGQILGQKLSKKPGK
jgi:hypothetical protein